MAHVPWSYRILRLDDILHELRVETALTDGHDTPHHVLDVFDTAAGAALGVAFVFKGLLGLLNQCDYLLDGAYQVVIPLKKREAEPDSFTNQSFSGWLGIPSTKVPPLRL